MHGWGQIPARVVVFRRRGYQVQRHLANQFEECRRQRGDAVLPPDIVRCLADTLGAAKRNRLSYPGQTPRWPMARTRQTEPARRSAEARYHTATEPGKQHHRQLLLLP